MKFILDSKTGNQVATFNAKLVSLGDTVLNLNNENRTEYVVGTLEFPNKHNQLVQRSCIVYKKNYDYGMTVGTSYLCRATKTPDRQEVLLTASHLTGAQRATADDFDFDEAVVDAFELEN